jgi:predicted HicB family RNase H-like nuclease
MPSEQPATEPELPSSSAKAMLTIRVSREEYSMVSQAAAKAKTSINQWCREFLVAMAKEELSELPC